MHAVHGADHNKLPEIDLFHGILADYKHDALGAGMI